MALASSPLIWVKLRLVTGIPKMAYAENAAAPAGEPAQVPQLAAVPPSEHW